RRWAPGEECLMSEVVAIKIQPPTCSSRRRPPAECRQRQTHLGGPNMSFFIHPADRLEAAVPIKGFCRPTQFEVQPLAVGRHLELVVMSGIIWIRADKGF